VETVSNVGKPRERWIWEKTWQAIDERKTQQRRNIRKIKPSG